MTLFGPEDLYVDSVSPNQDGSLDLFYIFNGFSKIAGVDEAGRGALAGPVCAAAVILGEKKIDGLNDSKKLVPEIREELYVEIWENALCVGVGMVGPAWIDEINILQASMRAMESAVGMLGTIPEIVLVDGNIVPAGIPNGVAIVKGDSKSKSIMAASIIAKVTRDRWMLKASREFPSYGFEVHKGYAVEDHYQALVNNGLTSIHRLSFSPCKEMSSGLRVKSRKGTITDRGLSERIR